MKIPSCCFIQQRSSSIEAFFGFDNGTVQKWVITNSIAKMILLVKRDSKQKATDIISYCNLVFVSSWDGLIQIYDNINKMSLRRTLKRKSRSAITGMQLVMGGIVTAHYDGTVTLYNFPRSLC